MPRPNHVYEIYIRTTPERLWQALVDPELTRRYYYGCRFEGAVAAGEKYAMRADDGSAAIEGTITEAEPFRRLVTTFQARFAPGTAEEPPSRGDVGDHAVGRRLPAVDGPRRPARLAPDLCRHGRRLAGADLQPQVAHRDRRLAPETSPMRARATRRAWTTTTTAPKVSRRTTSPGSCSSSPTARPTTTLG